MTTALALGQTSDCANPVLDLFTAVDGKLVDAYAVSFQIYDKRTGSPVQLYPVTSGDRVTLDVAHDCPTGARVSKGRYVATYTVPTTTGAPPVPFPTGLYEIVWYYTLISGGVEYTCAEDFEVLTTTVGPGYALFPLYCTIADMRDEGVPSSVPDAQNAKRIVLAQRFIEATTRRYFYPKVLTLKVDGTGGPKLFLSDPIIAIESVQFEVSPLYPEDFTLVESDIFRVYARHLSQGLLEPDDRNNPKIELFNPGFVRGGQHSLLSQLNFPVGQQSTRIKGVFGYTEPDGSSTGGTPPLITHVAKLLVMRELDKMTSAMRGDAQNRWRLQSEGTRDQNYSLEGLGALKLVPGNGFTGDPAIDNILAYFTRPPAMGAT